jgi:hypothetical protein
MPQVVYIVNTGLSNLPAPLWQLTTFTCYLTKIPTACAIKYSINPEITQSRFSLQIIEPYIVTLHMRSAENPHTHLTSTYCLSCWRYSIYSVHITVRDDGF